MRSDCNKAYKLVQFWQRHRPVSPQRLRVVLNRTFCKEHRSCQVSPSRAQSEDVCCNVGSSLQSERHMAFCPLVKVFVAACGRFVIKSLWTLLDESQAAAAEMLPHSELTELRLHIMCFCEVVCSTDCYCLHVLTVCYCWDGHGLYGWHLRFFIELYMCQSSLTCLM